MASEDATAGSFGDGWFSDDPTPQPDFDEQGDPIEPDEPEPPVAPDPRFAGNPLTARGTPRRRAQKCSPEELGERVEWCRGLIRLNFSAGDIKRMAAKKWNVTRKTVQSYISFARQRNRSILD